MRTMFKVTLTLGLMAMLASPALAQRQRPGGGGGGLPGGGGGFGGGGFGFGGPTALLTNKSVQEELKMTEEQVKKSGELSTKARDLMREKFQGLGMGDTEKFAAARKEVNEAIQKEVNTILTSEQQKRFKQISLQQQGARGFTSEDVQKTLNLTDEQKEAIKAIVENPQETVLKAIAGKLTPEQKKAWAELTGEKFEIKREAPRPGGGGGTNPRRPGGGGNRPGGGGARPPRVDLN